MSRIVIPWSSIPDSNVFLADLSSRFQKTHGRLPGEEDGLLQWVDALHDSRALAFTLVGNLGPRGRRIIREVIAEAVMSACEGMTEPEQEWAKLVTHRVREYYWKPTCEAREDFL